jgi:hypothetical protein
MSVVVAAHFAPLSLTREQRERLLLAMAGRDRAEVEWVEEVTCRSGGRTTAGDWQLWVTVIPTVDEVRRRDAIAADVGVPVVFRR